MNFRLARPTALIDINRVPGLDGIGEQAGKLRIGAMVRHARFEQPVTDGPLGRLLPRVAACIAHTPIRSRGTFGGSLAHADPAAEWCALSLALDAEVVAASRQGTRVIPASQFFTTIFTTALRADEVLTEIRLPRLDTSWRCGFAEFSRRAGDYALAMAVVALRLDQGVIREARVALGGVASTPVLAPAAMQLVTGAMPSDALLADAGAAARAGVNPDGDIHGSAEYRRDLVQAMVRRALRDALAA
jgi:carbon-monoxide dehydrogenase medium subunit